MNDKSWYNVGLRLSDGSRQAGLDIVRRTDKAVLCSMSNMPGASVWIPNSVCQIDDKNDLVLRIKGWFIKKALTLHEPAMYFEEVKPTVLKHDEVNYEVVCFIDSNVVQKEYFGLYETALAFEKEMSTVYDTISITPTNLNAERRMKE